MRTWVVDDVMTTEVVAADRSATYRDLVDLIIERRIGAVPVVDGYRRVTGVVSEADLLRKIEYADTGQPRLFESRRRRGERGKASARTAQELMSTPPVVALQGTPIAAAARLMDHEHVKHLPVVDDLGRVIGIVSRSDLLRVHLRSDDEIRDELRAAVVEGLDMGPAVSVEVADGVVTLTGRTQRRSTAELAAHLARQVAGVVHVSSTIEYVYDDYGYDPAATPIAVA